MSRANDILVAEESTELLRSSADPLWARLRELLRTKGLDPATVALGQCFPDDASFQFGILACPDGRVFTFGFDYLHKPIEHGELVEWVDITDKYTQSPYHDYANAAFRVLGRESAAI